MQLPPQKSGYAAGNASFIRDASCRAQCAQPRRPKRSARSCSTSLAGGLSSGEDTFSSALHASHARACMPQELPRSPALYAAPHAACMHLHMKRPVMLSAHGEDAACKLI